MQYKRRLTGSWLIRTVAKRQELLQGNRRSEWFNDTGCRVPRSLHRNLLRLSAKSHVFRKLTKTSFVPIDWAPVGNSNAPLRRGLVLVQGSHPAGFGRLVFHSRLHRFANNQECKCRSQSASSGALQVTRQRQVPFYIKSSEMAPASTCVYD